MLTGLREDILLAKSFFPEPIESFFSPVGDVEQEKIILPPFLDVLTSSKAMKGRGLRP